MQTIIFNHNFVNGWGDTFLCIFDIINCIDYIKQYYSNYKIIYTINNPYNSNVLDKVLNINFLNKFVNEFHLLNNQNLIKINNGKTIYNNLIYKRIYSGRNDDVNNNTPGAFDVFIPELDDVPNIPFIDFTFNDIDDRPKDFDIFNEKLVDDCNKFVIDNFHNKQFNSIFYRALNPINEIMMDTFVKKLENELDHNQEYFMCSNSSLIKEKLLNSNIKIKLFRDLEHHSKNNIPNGYVSSGLSIDDATFAVTEMLILSKCNTIYYSGEIHNISLFNWYPTNIKKVKLINL